MAWQSRNKYGSKKVIVDGITFDSKKEAHRFQELKLLEKAGEITELQRQVKYILIPEQREETDKVYTKGEKKGQPKKGILLERETAYIADFVYKDMRNGETIVEDTKGYKTKEYIIKRKLMMYIHGIRIREV